MLLILDELFNVTCYINFGIILSVSDVGNERETCWSGIMYLSVDSVPVHQL